MEGSEDAARSVYDTQYANCMTFEEFKKEIWNNAPVTIEDSQDATPGITSSLYPVLETPTPEVSPVIEEAAAAAAVTTPTLEALPVIESAAASAPSLDVLPVIESKRVSEETHATIGVKSGSLVAMESDLAQKFVEIGDKAVSNDVVDHVEQDAATFTRDVIKVHHTTADQNRILTHIFHGMIKKLMTGSKSGVNEKLMATIDTILTTWETEVVGIKLPSFMRSQTTSITQAAEQIKGILDVASINRMSDRDAEDIGTNVMAHILKKTKKTDVRLYIGHFSALVLQKIAKTDAYLANTCKAILTGFQKNPVVESRAKKGTPTLSQKMATYNDLPVIESKRMQKQSSRKISAPAPMTVIESKYYKGDSGSGSSKKELMSGSLVYKKFSRALYRAVAEEVGKCKDCTTVSFVVPSASSHDDCYFLAILNDPVKMRAAAKASLFRGDLAANENEEIESFLAEKFVSDPANKMLHRVEMNSVSGPATIDLTFAKAIVRKNAAPDKAGVSSIKTFISSDSLL